MERLRIARQIHCKAVEQRATLIHRQYNRDWGTSYSRPPIGPYLTSPLLQKCWRRHFRDEIWQTVPHSRHSQSHSNDVSDLIPIRVPLPRFIPIPDSLVFEISITIQQLTFLTHPVYLLGCSILQMEINHNEKFQRNNSRTRVENSEQQTGMVRFSDEEHVIENDDREAYTLRCKFDDEDGYDDEIADLPDFLGQRAHRGPRLRADATETESGRDEIQRNFSVWSIHSGLTDDDAEDERKRYSASRQRNQRSSSTKNPVTNNDYYGGNNSGDYERIGRIPKHSRYLKIRDEYSCNAEGYDSDDSETDYENLSPYRRHCSEKSTSSSNYDYLVCRQKQHSVRLLDLCFGKNSAPRAGKRTNFLLCASL